MGKTKTFTSATVVSLVTDSPDIVQQSVLNSIIRGTEISGDLITNLMNGLSSKMYTYFFKARHKKSTINLFPSSNYNLVGTRILDVKSTLSDIHNTQVSIYRCVMEPLQLDYLAYEYMAANYGYNFFDGSFSTKPPVIPTDIASNVVFENSQLTNGALTITYSVTVTSEDEYGETVYTRNEYTEVTNVTGLNTSDIYYHTVYYIGASDTLHYWNYNTSTNMYPYLTSTPFGYTDSYFPVVPIIEYTTNVTESPYQATDKYKLSNSLLKGIDLDIQNISDSLKESDNYGEIQQAYFLPSVRMRDDDQLALRYLFNYFNLLGSNQKYTQLSYTNWLNQTQGNYGNAFGNSLQIQMDGCKFDIEWLYITTDIVDGSWLFGSNDYGRTYETSNQAVPNDEDDRSIDTSSVTFYRKITDSQYEIVKAVGLTQTSYIDNSYSKVWTVSDIFSTGEEAPEPMAIPISPTFVKEVFPVLVERNTFMYRTYNLVLTFKKEITLKWYQTAFFSFVLIVIAIVITIYSVGTLAESMYGAYAAAGGGLAGAYAAASIAFTVAFYSAVASWAMGELIKQYGWETAGIIAAIVAVVMYAYGGFSTDGFSVSDFANVAMTSITDYFEDSLSELSKEFQDLLEEQSTWMEEYDAMMEEMFGLSDSFAELYKQYTQDKAIYYRMVPSTFMFVALELLLNEPEVLTTGIEQYTDTSLKATTKDDLI